MPPSPTAVQRDDRWLCWNVRIIAIDPEFGSRKETAGFFQAKNALNFNSVFEDLAMAFPRLTHERPPLSLWLSHNQPPSNTPCSVLCGSPAAAMPVFVDEDATKPTDYELAYHDRSRIDLSTIGTAPEVGVPLVALNYTFSRISSAISSPSKKRRLTVATQNDNSGEDLSTELVDTTLVDRNGFESKVKKRDGKCVVSGSSLSIGRLLCGPAFQAAHIVPRSQWVAYPLPEDRTTTKDTPTFQELAEGSIILSKPLIPSPHLPPPESATIEDPEVHARAKAALQKRYNSTWSLQNGLTMRSDIHALFDARLLSIHPVTLKIRLFAKIDWLLEYHDSTAHLHSDGVPPSRYALKYHYDQCVIENICAVQLEQSDSSGKSIMKLPSVEVIRQMGIKLKAAAGPRDLAHDLLFDDDEDMGAVDRGIVMEPEPSTPLLTDASPQAPTSLAELPSLSHTISSPASACDDAVPLLDAMVLQKRLARMVAQKEAEENVEAWMKERAKLAHGGSALAAIYLGGHSPTASDAPPDHWSEHPSKTFAALMFYVLVGSRRMSVRRVTGQFTENVSPPSNRCLMVA
ncbi:hypothetical protein K440DRAFT_645685 [Wilcoxina mikolae CBS 423.85]|nr:hypothetical protein K440DRAFT_645685 [Wilcoxina mikolae CBS 423.85]